MDRKDDEGHTAALRARRAERIQNSTKEHYSGRATGYETLRYWEEFDARKHYGARKNVTVLGEALRSYEFRIFFRFICFLLLRPWVRGFRSVSAFEFRFNDFFCTPTALRPSDLLVGGLSAVDESDRSFLLAVFLSYGRNLLL